MVAVFLRLQEKMLAKKVILQTKECLVHTLKGLCHSNIAHEQPRLTPKVLFTNRKHKTQNRCRDLQLCGSFHVPPKTSLHGLSLTHVY